MEDRVKTGEVRREAEFVGGVRDGVVNGERSETSMIKFIGWSGGLDVTAKEPHELTRLVARAVGDSLVVVLGLAFLCDLEFCAQLIMETSKAGHEVGGSGHRRVVDWSRVERGMVAEVGEERGLAG